MDSCVCFFMLLSLVQQPFAAGVRSLEAWTEDLLPHIQGFNEFTVCVRPCYVSSP